MPNDNSSILGRMFIVFGLLLLIPCAIGFQLLRINIWKGDALRNLWSQQTLDYIPIPAQRGNIYDTDGTLLATNSVVYKAAIDPKIDGLTSNQISEVCNTLASHSKYSNTYYHQKISSAPARSRYVVLSTNVDIDTYLELKKLDIRALILEEQYQRRYSFGTLAAHVLGFVNHNMEGMIGLERQYDDQLKGEDGQQQVRRDRNGRIFEYVGAPRRQPKQGYSLYTTIDAHIQAILEEELKAGVNRTKSNYGTGIVMDPGTGAIKAMANFPTFNPNQPASSETENRRNYAISDMIEPGSTFKLVTAIASVEQNVAHFGEKFETPADGTKLINGQMMRDHDPLGTLRFDQVFEKSSNIATAEIAMRLKPQVFYQYARNLGFGTPTNIDLPNEEPGRLQKPYEWSQVTQPWMAIGYEVQVTPIQLIQAYAGFANDGIMMRPYIVKRIVDSEDNTVKRFEPIRIRRIAKEETVKKLEPVFEDVVSDSGTGIWAQVPGLSIAGKTGTAQTYIDGQYRNEYRASFVGFFPAENPKYICLIVLDDPKTSIYGGTTAGVIFKDVANRIAGLDNDIQRQMAQAENPDRHKIYVPEASRMTLQEAKSLLRAQQIPFRIEGSGQWVSNQSPESGTALNEKNAEVVLTVSETKSDSLDKKIPEGYGRIPDLTGLDMRQASLMISKQGFNTKIIGSGTIYTQFPRAGDLMKKGRTVTVRGKGQSLETIAGEQNS